MNITPSLRPLTFSVLEYLKILSLQTALKHTHSVNIIPIDKKQANKQTSKQTKGNPQETKPHTNKSYPGTDVNFPLWEIFLRIPS